MTPHDNPSAASPVRTCIGCRERVAKRELLRVTAQVGPDGIAVVPDPEGTAPGRGAHLHPTAGCFEQAVRRRAFGRALRMKGDAGGLSTDQLKAHLMPSETE